MLYELGFAEAFVPPFIVYEIAYVIGVNLAYKLRADVTCFVPEPLDTVMFALVEQALFVNQPPNEYPVLGDSVTVTF